MEHVCLCQWHGHATEKQCLWCVRHHPCLVLRTELLREEQTGTGDGDKRPIPYSPLLFHFPLLCLPLLLSLLSPSLLSSPLSPLSISLCSANSRARAPTCEYQCSLLCYIPIAYFHPADHFDTDTVACSLMGIHSGGLLWWWCSPTDCAGAC